MSYFENNFINKYKDLFNYSDLIKEINQLKNMYITKKGNSLSERKLLSSLKSLDLVYFTNNVCESIHAKIAKFIPNRKITKNVFKDCINYILKNYAFNINNNIRKDYISRTLIIIIQKYNINQEPKFIDYNIFNTEIKKTISIMTKAININEINEIKNYIEETNLMKYDNDNKIEEDEILADNENEENSDSSSDSTNNNLNCIKENEFKNLKENMIKNNILEEHKFLDLGQSKPILNNKNENFDSNISLNSDKNESNNEINMNLNDILKDRDYLNLFTLDMKRDNSKIKELLLKEDEDDTGSVDINLKDLSLNDNIIKKKEKKKRKK